MADERVGLVNEAAAPIPELSEQLEGQIEGRLSEVKSWAEITGDGVDIVAICFLPAWHLSEPERKRLATKLARVLDLLVPVNFPPVVEAVIGLTLTAGAIAASRALTNGGHLPPFGPIKPDAPPAAATASDTSLTE